MGGGVVEASQVGRSDRDWVEMRGAIGPMVRASISRSCSCCLTPSSGCQSPLTQGSGRYFKEAWESEAKVRTEGDFVRPFSPGRKSRASGHEWEARNGGAGGRSLWGRSTNLLALGCLLPKHGSSPNGMNSHLLPEAPPRSVSSCPRPDRRA